MEVIPDSDSPSPPPSSPPPSSLPQTPVGERSTIVTLSRGEMIAAGTIGLIRRISSLGNIQDRMHSPDANPWQIDIEGAMAEMAYAKSVGAFWGAGVNTFKAPDVGNVQIRSTDIEGYSLIIRDNDSKDDVFVLVVGSAPRYRIAGWIRGLHGKDKRWVKAPNGRSPAYFVPQSELRPIVELV